MGHLWPNDEQWEFLRNYPDQSAKIVMLNLLKYRAMAYYSDHRDEIPCSGEEAYQRYAALALPCVESVGGRIVYSGKSGASVIGPVDEKWDEIIVVEYPSIAAFQEMAFSDEYRSVAYHRAAALEDSRLIPIFVI